jgi:hypothetical protein
VAFFCHWYIIGALPEAPTVNVAVCPTDTAWLAGCVVIETAVSFEPPPVPVELTLAAQPPKAKAGNEARRNANARAEKVVPFSLNNTQSLRWKERVVGASQRAEELQA